MRFLDQPRQNQLIPGGSASINRGEVVFGNIGCVQCHTKSMTTSPISTVQALRNVRADLFSDLALHNMGPGLADEVSQGGARGDEFRTAPLWGVGKRIFFLHDGRTRDIQQAIQAHKSAANATFPASEANRVVDNYNALPDLEKQNVLNFLRSL